MLIWGWGSAIGIKKKRMAKESNNKTESIRQLEEEVDVMFLFHFQRQVKKIQIKKPGCTALCRSTLIFSCNFFFFSRFKENR